MYAFVCPISTVCILNLNRHQDSSSYRIINEQGSVSTEWLSMARYGKKHVKKYFIFSELRL